MRLGFDVLMVRVGGGGGGVEEGACIFRNKGIFAETV